jgi:hypothetical protein
LSQFQLQDSSSYRIITGHVTLKAGSIHAHKLALAGEVGLPVTLKALVILGNRINLAERISKGNTWKMKYNGIIFMKSIAIASMIGIETRLPLNKNILIRGSQVVNVPPANNLSKPVALIVHLIEIEKSVLLWV